LKLPYTTPRTPGWLFFRDVWALQSANDLPDRMMLRRISLGKTSWSVVDVYRSSPMPVCVVGMAVQADVADGQDLGCLVLPS